MANPLVSVIVPYKSGYPWVRECVKHCKEMPYRNIEIILLPDGNESPSKYPGCRVVPTGIVNHSAKRNRGMKAAKGSVYAFIDSDAFPRKDWVTNSLKYLEDKSIGIIGGPNLTPENDSLMQKAGGDVLGSAIGAGGISERYSVRKEKDTDALPSVNMLIRKDVFDRLGHGWDETLVTGEDVKISYQVLDAGYRIHYSPDVIVYHHRRALFLPHMEQIWNYGRDEGLLVQQRKRIDRPLVLMPPLFVLWLPIVWALGFYIIEAYWALLASVAVYCGVTLAGAVAASWKRFPLVWLGIIATHLTYGMGFWRGLLLPQKKFHAGFRKKHYNR